MRLSTGGEQLRSTVTVCSYPKSLYIMVSKALKSVKLKSHAMSTQQTMIKELPYVKKLAWSVNGFG